MESLSEYVETSQLVDWAKVNLDIVKPDSDMTDEDIRRTMRWIGMCAVDVAGGCLSCWLVRTSLMMSTA